MIIKTSVLRAEAWEVWPVKVQGGEELTESRGKKKTVKEAKEIGLLQKGMMNAVNILVGRVNHISKTERQITALAGVVQWIEH